MSVMGHRSRKLNWRKRFAFFFISGSFKIRGVLNQMCKILKRYGSDAKLVTMSAGNYGKAFAHCVGKRATKSVCYMPVTAPKDRVATIEVSYNLFFVLYHSLISYQQGKI